MFANAKKLSDLMIVVFPDHTHLLFLSMRGKRKKKSKINKNEDWSHINGFVC